MNKRYHSPSLPRQLELRAKKPLHEYIKDHAQRTPDKPALIYYGTEITYRELDRSVECCANMLANYGVRKGDAVALYMQNSPQFVFAFFGIQRIGAIVGPCSPMFKEWELEYEVNELRAKVILADETSYSVIANIKENTTLEKIVLTRHSDFLPENPTLLLPEELKNCRPATDEYPEGTINFMAAIRSLEPKAPEVAIDVEKDIALLIFTSGTTGMPKGAMLNYYSALYKGVGVGQAYHMGEFDVYLNTQPLFHIAGMAMFHAQMYNGSTVILLNRYTPESVMAAIDTYQCNRWYSTAIMNDQILNHPDLDNYNLTSIRINPCTSFGIQLTEDLARKWAEKTKGGILLEAAYGLSESHTMDTTMPLERIKYGTHGVSFFDDMEIKILNFETREECEPNEMGEILLRNPAIFKGYLRNQEKTDEVLKDGWLYTGDMGKLDDEGFLTWMGRKKEMIKSSGFSVFPEEVEGFLVKHPAVAQVAVIGKDDPKREQIVKAFVVLEGSYTGPISEKEIIEWCHDKMASYKRPREVEFIKSIPTSGPGKILRRILAEEEAKKSS
ncbi:AMP-binding protein [uncultured Desulfosarcina sp.]|uniref:AMP-binding protein n=1 Tax=uncultured Desulfosarcina sp. TaxID=218289 RepID=UPI0029C5FF3D|nr:AMP-binding protein [uncultured Desulfosarcina sp.]